MGVILAGTYLMINTVLDIRKREISIKLSGIFGIIGILIVGMNFERVMGVVLGLLTLGVARLVKDFGMGDGVVILILGLLLGLIHTLNILLIASILASGIGLFLLIIKKKTVKYELPFVPFLLVGFLVGVLL